MNLNKPVPIDRGCAGDDTFEAFPARWRPAIPATRNEPIKLHPYSNPVKLVPDVLTVTMRCSDRLPRPSEDHDT